MEVKEFKGKAIYQPKGKAGEYAKWACNFYKGCSNGCTYCYLKKGRGAAVLGGSEPKLKACFKDEAHAMKVFEKELNSNLPELQKNGLFFTFTSDPVLPETLGLTMNAAGLATDNLVPVKILTKCTEFADWYVEWAKKDALTHMELWAFGFTLTGHDELEPGASTNAERIEAMRKLHDAGLKTFASIEPIIDFESSLKMIESTKDFCDLFKIGLESGKNYDKSKALEFYVKVNLMLSCRSNAKVYWKDSFLKLIIVTRFICIENFRATVDSDYNMFNH